MMKGMDDVAARPGRATPIFPGEETGSPLAWERYVEGDEDRTREADEHTVAWFAEVIGSYLRVLDSAIAIDGEPAAVRAVAAAAARRALRAEGIAGHRSLWWNAPRGAAAKDVFPGVAEALRRPCPYGIRPLPWVMDLLAEQGIRLAVLAGLHHVTRGPGSVNLRRHELRSLIRNTWRHTTVVLLGTDVRKELFERPGGDQLLPFVTVLRLEAAARSTIAPSAPQGREQLGGTP